jgi:hypothetical protein
VAQLGEARNCKQRQSDWCEGGATLNVPYPEAVERNAVIAPTL